MELAMSDVSIDTISDMNFILNWYGWFLHIFSGINLVALVSLQSVLNGAFHRDIQILVLKLNLIDNVCNNLDSR
ncbi:hypothetical protein BD408DRAFT_373666 [Parasitella parasitica]|nr:hypothetical protein BD408DRAFT_373666 [Parasitella parasitica]